MNKINLRPAGLVDAEILAKLWVAIFPDKFGPIFGKKGEAVLCDWFRLSRRYLQTTTLAEIDQTTVGFIVLKTLTSLRPDDERWLWYALQLHNGILGALRGLLLMWLIDQNRQCRPGEVYIEMLGVAPPWQRRGVASRLMSHAEAVAQAQQARQLSLNVMIDNFPAVCLYEKTGFHLKSERRSRLLHWVTGHAGYYEMVKDVDLTGLTRNFSA